LSRFSSTTWRRAAADHETEEIGVLGPADADDRAVCQQEAERPDGLDQGAEPRIAFVHVDAQRAADGEGRVGLHDADREAVLVGRRDDLVPGGAALDGDRAGGRVDSEDFVEGGHVEDDGIVVKGMPAHAVALAGDRHLEVARPCLGERGLQLCDLVLLHHGLHRGRVEPAHVVDEHPLGGGREPRRPCAEEQRREQQDREFLHEGRPRKTCCRDLTGAAAPSGPPG
jgi:hypothetical protein